MEKIKQTLSNIWGYLVLIFGAIIGILFFFLYKRNEQLLALEERINLSKTQKEADLVEVEINQMKASLQGNDKELKDLEATEKLLKDKRDSLKANKLADNEIEDYWSKK